MLHFWKCVGSVFPSESVGALGTTILQRVLFKFHVQKWWIIWFGWLGLAETRPNCGRDHSLSIIGVTRLS